VVVVVVVVVVVALVAFKSLWNLPGI
jgi:hypothetical protein